MAFFSFSLSDKNFHFFGNQLKSGITYYSKELTLWKELNNTKNKIKLNFIKNEKRIKLNKLGKKILICLPPNFGLGDAIEYGIAIKSLIKFSKYLKIGVAFTGKNTFIFKQIYFLKNLYPYYISISELEEYDSIFHLTLEIESFKFQKYKRSDIVFEICNFFNLPIIKHKVDYVVSENKINKNISIFPISTSVIRCMPLSVVESIIKNFEKNYKIDIYLDDSYISIKYKKFLIEKNISFKNPSSIKNLIDNIAKINFGIFVDSGPLHVAKILNKKGVLIETSVCSNVLLRGISEITPIKNLYKSNYCNGPCGLTDVFSYQNSVGCYETNKISFQNIKNIKNLKSLQRRNKLENNLHFLSNPVGCIDKINIQKIIELIILKLKAN